MKKFELKIGRYTIARDEEGKVTCTDHEDHLGDGLDEYVPETQDMEQAGYNYTGDMIAEIVGGLVDEIERSRETSPEIASLAGRILQAGNPLHNEQVKQAINRAIATGECQGGGVNYHTVHRELEAVLNCYFDNMLSLAASCVSQAHGE